jgi:predicted Zn-dependent peptidase
VLFAASLGGAVVPAAQAPDRTKPPQPGPPPTLKLPAIQKRQLSNGLPVWIVERHGVPVVQINLVVLHGSTDDPAGKFGLTSLMTAMLEEGAGSRSALQIADAIDFLGADLGTGSTFDASAIRLHVPVARLAEALPIMADVALRPTFPQEELDRLRQQRLTEILQARDDPSSIASQAFPRVLYGGTHRYGTPTMGTAATIKAAAVADLREQYAAIFRPDSATLVAVGDVTPDTLVPLLEAGFGSWRPSGSAQPVTLPTVEEPLKREVFLVDKPGAAQSQIRIGWIGVARSTSDYFPVQVMNTILGGSFSSRLNMNLREQHGYTYGAGSSFDMRASAGPFVAGAGVQTDKTAESLTEFFNELNGILKKVPEDEVERARSYAALRFPSAFEATSDISRRLEDMLIYHLPDDYFATYVHNIEAVGSTEVARVARMYIQPGRFAVVVVGDRKVIEPGIRALNLGTIKPLSIDDVFGPLPTGGK